MWSYNVVSELWSHHNNLDAVRGKTNGEGTMFFAYGDTIFLFFGQQCGGSAFNDRYFMYTISSNTWSDITDSMIGSLPQPRVHVMYTEHFDGSQTVFYVFGGAGHSDSNLYKYTPATYSWEIVLNPTAQAPSSRHSRGDLALYQMGTGPDWTLNLYTRSGDDWQIWTFSPPCNSDYYDDNGTCIVCSVCKSPSEVETASCGGSADAVCECAEGYKKASGECVPEGYTSDSYGVAATAAQSSCPGDVSAVCWQINIAVMGAPPAESKYALYINSVAVPFPCSLTTSKCDCLEAISGAFAVTTLAEVNASGGCDVDAAFAAPLDMAQSGVWIQESGGDYTIFITEAALDDLTTLSPVEGGYRADLQVGLVELMPVGDLDYFDAVPHETTVTVEQTIFATYSSVSEQKATSLSFANARVHKVHDDSDGLYYAAVSFVVEGGNISGVEVPLSSIVVTAEGTPMDVACGANSFTPEEAALFRQGCAPFSALPDETPPPFCSGTLHVSSSGSRGLASVFVPLVDVPGPEVDSLQVEFVISTSGTDAPTLETVAVTINNLGASGGFVEWCEDAASDSVNFVTDSALEVGMYAGVVLPEERGMFTLATLSSVAGATVPPPRATIMEGVISVTVNCTEGYDVEVVKLAAVYVEGATPGTSVTASYLKRVPTAEYNPATGTVSMATDDLCMDSAVCEVKEMDVAGGWTPQCLQLKAPGLTKEAAADWIKDVAGTSNPFIDEVGQHFFKQFADFKAAYWINPRKDTSARAVAVGSSIPSTTVVVFALLRVSASTGGRRSSRYLLQSVGGGSDSLSSGVSRLEVSAASLAASVLGVSPEVVSSWRVRMSVSAAEACLPAEQLAKGARALLLAALADAASELLDVQVTSVSVDAAGVECAQERRLLPSSAPTMEVEALLIFVDDGSKPFVDVAKLEASPGIHSVEQSDDSPVVKVVESAPPAQEPHAPAEASETESDSSNNILLVFVASAAGLVALVAAGVALWAWRRMARSEDAVKLSATAVHDSLHKGGGKIEQVLGNITYTLEVHSDSDRATSAASSHALESQA